MKKTDYCEISKQKMKYFRYSDNTITIYSHYINEFISSINVYPTKLTSSDFQKYLDNYKFSSSSQQNQIISALKFLYERVLDKKYLKVNFTRPRKEKRLPKVIDKNLIINNLSKIKNTKHKAILTLTFSVGLRVSEVINLKMSDIDSKRMVIYINNSKGKKDRVVPLTKNVLLLLREYYREYKPKVYLFNGQFSLKYSTTSCNNIYKKYIDSKGHFHTMRHSAATAMLENGTDLRLIQEILGHKNSKTTEMYTHISVNTLQNANLPI